MPMERLAAASMAKSTPLSVVSQVSCVSLGKVESLEAPAKPRYNGCLKEGLPLHSTRRATFMDMTTLPLMTVTALAPLLARREISPVEVTRAHLQRIERLNPRLNAYLTVLADAALQAAQQAEQAIVAGGYLGPWHGIPIAVKDLLDTAGIRTTYGSTLFATHVPQRTATALARLTRAGAIVLGKLNLHEFATGGDPFNPHYGLARNPWKPDEHYSSAGSSGGSGVATAASLAMATLGTDTGGSIRLPAALCGIVGLKPTYGRVSRMGVWPVSASLDTVGPMTRTVADCALMLGTIAGYDPADQTSSRRAVPDYLAALPRSLRGLKVGVVQHPLAEYVMTDIAHALTHARSVFQQFGMEVLDVTVPMLRHSAAIYTTIVSADAYNVHAAMLRQQPQAYGPMVRQRYTLGALIPAADYLQAQRARFLLCRQFAEVLRQVDVLLMPTTLTPAESVQGATQEIIHIDGRPLPKTLAASRLTQAFNLTGLPALSLPCGLSEQGLPLGLQLAGRPFDEATLFAVGHAYEQQTGWERQHPPV